MPHDVYYDFTQRPEYTRRIGARGGRATARNRRERLSSAVLPILPFEVAPRSECEPETVAAASAILDAQFPWLCGAEKRGGRLPAATRSQAGRRPTGLRTEKT